MNLYTVNDFLVFRLCSPVLSHDNLSWNVLKMPKILGHVVSLYSCSQQTRYRYVVSHRDLSRFAKTSSHRFCSLSQDLSFTEDECLYMLFPVKGGTYLKRSQRFSKHVQTPIVSSEKICIKSCGEYMSYGRCWGSYATVPSLDLKLHGQDGPPGLLIY